MSLDTTISRAAAEYDHSHVVGFAYKGDGHFQSPEFLRNINCIMQAPVSRVATQYISRPDIEHRFRDDTDDGLGLSQRRSPVKASTFENIPYEIFLSVADQLPISSLIQLAATNTNMRKLVRGLPWLRKLKANPHMNHALFRMLLAGTARHITLEHLRRVFTSSNCAVCGSDGHFAPYLCLLKCRRLCIECLIQNEQPLYIPTDVAVKIMGVSLAGLLEQEIVAEARFEPGKPDPTFEMYGIHDGNRCQTRVSVVSFPGAVALAARQHEAAGGMKVVQSLLNQFVADSGVHLESSTSTRLADGYEVKGLAYSIALTWAAQNIEWAVAKRSLAVSVPYLNGQSSQPFLEQGFWCEGCRRDNWLHPPRCCRCCYPRYLNYPRLYLKDQFERHFKQCSSAQLIARQQRLTVAEEEKLYKTLKSKVSEYWPGKFCPPSISTLLRTFKVDRTSEEAKGRTAKVMGIITATGNELRQEEQRLAAEQFALAWSAKEKEKQPDELVESESRKPFLRERKLLDPRRPSSKIARMKKRNALSTPMGMVHGRGAVVAEHKASTLSINSHESISELEKAMERLHLDDNIDS